MVEAGAVAKGQKTQYLLLTSLREVIAIGVSQRGNDRSIAEHLRPHVPRVLPILTQHADSQEESVRNVFAPYGTVVSVKVLPPSDKPEEKREKKLADFERSFNALEGWLQAEHASASQVLLHNNAKLNYVAQHARHLQDFANFLAQIQSLEEYINPPAMKELPKHSERLLQVEASSATTVGLAVDLHSTVAQIAEDYHKTMVGVNSQLLQWDRLLDSGQ